MKCDKCEIEMVKMKSRREAGGKTTYYKCPKCGATAEYYEAKKKGKPDDR